MKETDSEAHLAKRLGLGAATMAGVGVILGAGIYVLVGIAAGEAGNAVWLSFLFSTFLEKCKNSNHCNNEEKEPKTNFEDVNYPRPSRIRFVFRSYGCHSA